tara:strand:- start:224 stop:394 length:171 start_codon:yes stop_codon:yes gene_type:complete
MLAVDALLVRIDVDGAFQEMSEREASVFQNACRLPRVKHIDDVDTKITLDDRIIIK